jgi:putative transposase
LAIEVAQSLTGDDVVRILARITRERNQTPLRIQADNGLEFVSLVLDKWAYENNVTLDFLEQENQLINHLLNHLTEVSVMNA